MQSWAAGNSQRSARAALASRQCPHRHPRRHPRRRGGAPADHAQQARGRLLRAL